MPELHTTRSFEIPACNTALVTESNPEINTVFSGEEVIYFDHADEVAPRVSYYMSNPGKLKELTQRGHKAVMEGGYSYVDILKKLLKQIDE